MGSSAVDFLRLVLPINGYKCAAVFAGLAPKHKFFTSVEELAAFISTEDARGFTVYHACASFKTAGNRKGENACAARSFWLDVDAGDGKPYPDVFAAAEAVHAFVRDTGLPNPVYVGSGMGLHVYWPLVEDLDPATWKQYAAALRALCYRHSLHIDPVRTADISSVLRTPGTRNRKHGEMLVRVGDLAGPYEIGEFDAILPILRDRARPLVLGGSLAVRSQSVPRSLAAAGLNIYGPDIPSDPEQVADACGQVGWLRDSYGLLPEPNWYAAIGVLVHCQGGEGLAHEWSVGHENYTFEETQGRIDRRKALPPTTCEHFHFLRPDVCAACRHCGSISTPVQLGRPRQKPVEVVPEIAAPVEPSQWMPDGYRLLDGALVVKTETTDGVDNFEMISRHTVYLSRIQTGEADSDTHHYIFKTIKPHEGEREIAVPARKLFGQTGIAEMAERGVVIHNAMKWQSYVRAAVDMHTEHKRAETRYDQFGWKDDDRAFLVGKRLYTAGKVETVVAAPELEYRSKLLGPKAGGSLARWTSAADQLFAPGFEPQSVALLASFAGPLMRFHSGGEGGAILSFVSDQSGSGKTTALEAGASVWGDLRGTQLDDNDTKVAKGLKLGLFGNLSCTYDELHKQDAELIRQFVLMFTNGKDKDRGTIEGALRHTRSEWQTILLLASNQSIADTLANMGGTDAPAFRVMEFVQELPPGADLRRGDHLKREFAANYGWAGDAYLRALVNPDVLDYIKRALPQWTDEIWAVTGLQSEHRFWVRAVSSIIAAAVIVEKYGILHFSPGRVKDWLIAQVREMASNATVTRVRDNSSIVSEFLSEHVLDTLVVARAWKSGTARSIVPLLEPRRNLWARYEQEEGRLFIQEQYWRKWLLKKGVNRKSVMADLHKKQVLLNDQRRVTLGAGTDYASGQVTAIEIDMHNPLVSGAIRVIQSVMPADKRAVQP